MLNQRFSGRKRTCPCEDTVPSLEVTLLPPYSSALDASGLTHQRHLRLLWVLPVAQGLRRLVPQVAGWHQSTVFGHSAR
jgi:hypothetical protein